MPRQFEKVNCSRGAPMGRHRYGYAPDAGGKIRLFRVRLDAGGYDDGGAYWGIGEPLYCACDQGGEYREFTRAASRRAARDAMNIDNSQLARPCAE